MMFNAEDYIIRLTELLKDRFSSRLAYVGLQGSYLRGEETEESDIDIMVVIDGFSVCDMEAYKMAIESLELSKKSCGFICGTEDLKNWNSLEICHLLNTTKDYFGTLTELVPKYTTEDVRSFVKLSLGNLYHELCHRFIHSEREKTVSALPHIYKSVFFILQDLHYLESGCFMSCKKDLAEVLTGKDKLVLETAISVSCGAEFDFDEAFDLLFTWCKEALGRF